MDKNIALNKNLVVKKLQKSPSQFALSDIISFIESEGIEMVNFMYPAGDGRLKTLNFVINSLEYLETILSCGERVDGSSLFSYIEPGNSDLYVMPRFSTAFVDPFAQIPTLTMLCSFFDKDGNRLETSPEYTLHKACEEFKRVTGTTFEAMGELEFYVIAPDNEQFPARDQKGYHESGPFAKFNEFRTQCMAYIAQAGGQIKYGHSEVGNFTLDGLTYEQNEIEFLPVDGRDAADQLMIAKWIIRNLGYQMGYDVTFAPKITTGKAGSGLHIHMRITKDGKNMMLNADRKLSKEARTIIAGMMEMAKSVTAFGNVNPTSYFRLVPHQEAPTNICWGDRNRSVLVRVPLGWTSDCDMCSAVNHNSHSMPGISAQKQTVEIRSADGSADIYLLIAALAVACRYGFEMENAQQVADNTYVNVNIHEAENAEKAAKLDHLPANCGESADALQQHRHIYEQYGVFAPRMIDGIIKNLKSFDDKDLIARAKNDTDFMSQIVKQYFHCG